RARDPPCLILSCCRAPRVLRPFPPRRSSDLVRCAARVGRDEREVGGGEPVVDLARLRAGTDADPAGQVRHAAYRAFGEAGEDEQDRKSTRLNSSHRTISYAVFCLKKKKEPRS